MSPNEQSALLAVALMAAFADGVKDDRERDSIKRIAESLAGSGEALQLSNVYQDVLLKRLDIRQCVDALTDPAHRQLAYELAVGVCDADGQLNSSEQKFLSDLKRCSA